MIFFISIFTFLSLVSDARLLGNGGSSGTAVMHEGRSPCRPVIDQQQPAGDNDATAGAVQHCTAEKEPCMGKTQTCNCITYMSVLRHVCAGGAMW